VPASVVRTALGLRSTWLSFGVLRLDRPAGSLVFGSSLELSGISRGLRAPFLATSPDGAVWARAGALSRAVGGDFAVTVKPVRTTRYRIEVEGATSPAMLVQVTPRLQLAAPIEPGALTGSVRPKLAGETISIERRNGARWVSVGQSTVDESGAFRVELTLVPGGYRARIAATADLAAGVSPTLEVTG
jgi:hypothetical protein